MRINTPLIVTFILGASIVGFSLYCISFKDIKLIFIVVLLLIQGIYLLNNTIKGATLRISVNNNDFKASFFTLSYIPPFIKKKSVGISIQNILEVLYYPDRFGYCFGIQFLASEDDNASEKLDSWELIQKAKDEYPGFHFRYLDLYMGTLCKNDFNTLWQINEIKPEIDFNIPSNVNRKFDAILHKQIDSDENTAFEERPKIFKTSILWILIFLFIVSIVIFIGIDIESKIEFLKEFTLYLILFLLSFAIITRYYYLRYSYHRITSNGVSINDLPMVIQGISIFPINIRINYENIIWAGPYSNRIELNRKYKEYSLKRLSGKVIQIWSEGYFYMPRYTINIIYKINGVYRAVQFPASKAFHKVFGEQLADRNIDNSFSNEKLPKTPVAPYYAGLFLLVTLLLLMNWNTTDPTFYYFRGKAYLYLMLPDKAEKDLLKAYQLRLMGDKESDLYYLLGYCYEYKDDYKTALDNYRKALNIYPDNDVQYRISKIGWIVNEYIQEARKLYPEKKYDEAIELINKALEIDPNNYDVYNERGQVYSDIEDYYKAIEDFSKAIDLFPHNSTYFCNRAYAFLLINDQDKSLNDYKKALEIDPANNIIHFNIGCILMNKKLYNDALTYYNKAIEINGTEHSGSYNNRGLVYEHMNQYDKALQDYNRAIEIDTKDSAPYNNRANIYKMRGDKDKALNDYNKAIEVNPVDNIAFYNRGLLYLELDNKKLAIQDFKKALEIDPYYKDAREQLELLGVK